MLKHSTGSPTKAQSKRFERMKMQGACMACIVAGIQEQWQYIEINHIVDANSRLGHDETYSLCVWHHRGTNQGYKDPSNPGMDRRISDLRRELGPALSGINSESVIFHEKFGSDSVLLELQNLILTEGVNWDEYDSFVA